MGEIKVYGKGLISKLNTEGDFRLTWDTNDAEAIAAAKMMFDVNMKIEGMNAYELEEDSKKVKTKLKRFNPLAGEIILVPQLGGG